MIKKCILAFLVAFTAAASSYAQTANDETPVHGIVAGQFVYVCCPPCVKKMAADPTKFLSVLDDLYEASLKK